MYRAGRTVFEQFVFFLGGNAGGTQSTGHQLGEGELMALPLDVVTIELLVRFLKYLPRYNRLMLALVPITTIARVFKRPIIEWILDNPEDITESEIVIADRFKV